MTELSFRVRGPKLTLDLDLDPGLFAFMGNAADGIFHLFELVTGLAEPGRGSVLVAQTAPFSNPQLRRRIGSLMWEESLLPASTVSASLAEKLSILGQKARSSDCLERFGLSRLAPLSPSALGREEKRSIALALALSLETPAALALCSPLSDHLIARETVLEGLREHAPNCPVLLLVHDPEALRGLDVSTRLLQGGHVVRTVDPRDELDPALVGSAWAELPNQQLTVITRDPAALAAALNSALAESPEEKPIQLIQLAHSVLLVGSPLAALSQLVIQTAANSGIVLDAISCSTPSLAALQAAASGYPQGVLARAYRHSSSQDTQ